MPQSTDPLDRDNLSRSAVPSELRTTALLVDWLDSRFRIPGTNFRFGLDPLIGLVPGFGDGLDFLLSAAVLLNLIRRGASGELVIKMVWNVVLDALISALPLLGDILDFAFKANRRNLELALEHYAESRHNGSAIPYILLALLLLVLVATLIMALLASFLSDMLQLLSGGKG